MRPSKAETAVLCSLDRISGYRRNSQQSQAIEHSVFVVGCCTFHYLHYASLTIMLRSLLRQFEHPGRCAIAFQLHSRSTELH